MEAPRSVSYWYLSEDGQQQREDSQVRSDPLSSKTAAQVLRHGHDLNTRFRINTEECLLDFSGPVWPASQLMAESTLGTEMHQLDQPLQTDWLM